MNKILVDLENIDTLFRILRMDKGYKDNHKGHCQSYKYIPVTTIIPLTRILKKLRIRSLIDLGCGNGQLITILKTLLGIEVKGYEYNLELLLDKPSFNQWTFQKDIFELSSIDFIGYQAIYFYDPFKPETELEKKFVSFLERNMFKGQYLLIAQYNTFKLFEKSKKFKEIKLEFRNKNNHTHYSNISVFRKI